VTRPRGALGDPNVRTHTHTHTLCGVSIATCDRSMSIGPTRSDPRDRSIDRSDHQNPRVAGVHAMRSRRSTGRFSRSIDRSDPWVRSRRNIRSTSSVVIVRRRRRQCATTTVPDDDDARLRRVDAAHRDAYTPWGVVRSRTHPSRADDDDDDGDGDGDARDRSRDDDDGGVGARGARGANERCDARRASTNGRARCV